MIALDTETTGLDLKHGALPYFVTVCRSEDNTVTSWEMPVNVYTRRVEAHKRVLADIGKTIASADEIVLQNAKFDYQALHALSPQLLWGWDWGKVQDTLIAGHVLCSNEDHDLTHFAMRYLEMDILPLEKKLKVECNKARNYCRRRLKPWRIAKSGYPDMPSAKDKNWKFDTWLPKTLVKHLWDNSGPGTMYQELQLGGTISKSSLSRFIATASQLEGWELRPPGVAPEPDFVPDGRWTVLEDYANADSQVTLLVWQVMKKELERRNLWRIYQERMKVVPIVTSMEMNGVTVNSSRLDQLSLEYANDSRNFSRRCVSIAKSLGCDLVMPKTGNNQSLRNFCFGYQPMEKGPDGEEVPIGPFRPGLDLPVVKRSKKTGMPSLDKEALAKYVEQLPKGGKPLAFLRTLMLKRKRDTAITYMKGYKRFWLPVTPCKVDLLGQPITEWWRLFPSINPTGTNTLRFSSSNPNEQNISKQGMPCRHCYGSGCDECNDQGIDPRSLRLCFGPAPGREWWSFDAKNIELRIPTYESGEPEMVALFERPDDPPFYGSNHMLIFSILWPELWDKAVKEVGPEKAGSYCKKKYKDTEYQWTKNGNFAVQYGAVDKDNGMGTADRAYHQKGAQKKVASRFKKQEALNQYWISHANKYGYVETMPDKSVDPLRGYPIECTVTDRGKIKPTVPLNYHVQGTAMWWMMKAMIRVHDLFSDLNSGKIWEGRKWPGGYFIVMQIHDELVLDMPSGRGKGPNIWSYNEPIAREVVRLMEKGGEDIGIPTPASMEYHEVSWSEGVSV